MNRDKKKKKPVPSHHKPAVKTAAPAMGPARRRLFTVLMVALPILFIILLELTLRIFHYGGDWDLVLTKDVDGLKFHYINRQVAKRYFLSDEISIPNANDEAFAFKKAPNTVRIFCLGESTTAGWPFQYNAPFPSQLHERLSLLYPGYEFEVINVGISAISSYSILDFTRELLRYDPDLFLIYMGHNEFYGALGSASTQSLGSSRTLVTWYLKLEKLRLFQLLRDGYGRLRSSARSGENAQTLMERMIGEKTILLGSPEYNLAKSNLAANLGEMLQRIRDHGTPVLVGTLVSNLADQPPFESVFPPGFARQEEWQMLSASGDQAAKQGNYLAAIQAYMSAWHLNNGVAMLSYKIGKCQQAVGRGDLALSYFERARDLDALPFRAPGEFNQIIRRVCAENQVPVVEIEKAFAAASPDGLIGDNLILEHLHPNVEGHFIIADAFCHAMSDHNLIQPAASWPWQHDLPREQLIARAYVTDLDLEIANQRIQQLTSRYPFRQVKKIAVTSDAEYAKVLSSMAQAILRHQISWNEAHYRVADYLGQKGRMEEAEREYRAVIRLMPMHYYPYIFLANTLIAQNKLDEAEAALIVATRYSSNLPFGYAKLGTLYMSRQEGEKAIPFLEKAISYAGNSADFSSNDLSFIHYLLSVALAQKEEWKRARTEVDLAIKLNPSESRFRKLAAQLDVAGVEHN